MEIFLIIIIILLGLITYMIFRLTNSLEKRVNKRANFYAYNIREKLCEISNKEYTKKDKFWSQASFDWIHMVDEMKKELEKE